MILLSTAISFLSVFEPKNLEIGIALVSPLESLAEDSFDTSFRLRLMFIPPRFIAVSRDC